MTVRAQLRGVLDCRQARLLDPKWWQRSALLINAMAREDEREILRAAFDFNRSLLGNSQLTEDSFKGAQKRSRDILYDIVSGVQPWAKRTHAEAEAGENAGLAALYRQVCGDTRDPEFQKKIAHDVELLQQRGAQAAQTDALLQEKIKERKRQQQRRGKDATHASAK